MHVLLIDYGKSERYHLKYKLPTVLYINLPENCWSNDEKSKEFVTKILIFYVKSTIDVLKLRNVENSCYSPNILKIYNNCIVKHPSQSDLSFQSNNNSNVESQLLRRKVQEWFSNKASKQIQSDNIDTKISVLKSLQTKWVASFHDKIKFCLE